jgi:glycosyltransferase involved in cell wall biosynthesis
MVRQADRVALGEAKRIFTNSRNVQGRLWDSLRLPSEPLYHPSPAAEALFAREPGPYGDYVFLPGRMEALKRQSLVLDAMRHVRSDVRLVLVGRGPDEPVLRERAARLGLADRIVFEIDVPDERLYELYLGSLAVSYGPFDEDYGYVTIEAFAARRPVVTTTDAGGPLEFVADGETGLVVPPEPDAIAEAFDRLAGDRALAARLGNAGHALARERVPGWPEIVARLTE